MIPEDAPLFSISECRTVGPRQSPPYEGVQSSRACPEYVEGFNVQRQIRDVIVFVIMLR